MTFHNDAFPKSQTHFRIAIGIIFIVAAMLRFYGQDWDSGHYFHPDERFIATVMDSRLSLPPPGDLHLLLNPANSPLNTRSDDENGQPQEFAYGSLPFIVATVIGSVSGLILGTDLTSYSEVGQFGRFLTALIDLGTVGIVILFARRAFGDLAAIIAGILTAASVILIQLAHFFTVDTWVTFFVAASLYASYRVAEDFDFRWSIAAAALGGAALATKVSVGVLGIPILLGLIIGAQRVTASRAETISRLARRLAGCAISTVAVFAVFEPYAIWRPGPFFDDIRRQWEIVNGHFDIPFTRQFVGTISGVNEIENLVLWGVAPGFGIAALIATGIGLYRAVRLRDVRYILLLSWLVPYFYVIASSEARFLRYSAPLVPPLAIMVGHLLSVWWYQRGTALKSRIAPVAGITTVCGVTIAWALLFMSVYAGTHPRVDASQWIYENVPPGSTITHEIWDDRLPVGLEGMTGDIYEYRGLDLYSDRTNEEAVDFIADFLADADYIVLSSQRLSHSIPRLPWRYPVQSAYYRLLEQEKLGYELALEATNNPGIGTLRINTLAADESFSVYDHPPVRIFRKVENLSRDELELRFAHALAQPRSPHREPPDTASLRLSEPVGERSANTTAGWSSAVTRYSPAAVAFWLIAVGMAGIAGYPVTTRLFSRFSDVGIGFAPLVGILGTGVLAWLAWSLELAGLNVWLVVLSLSALGVTSWVVLGKRQPNPFPLTERLPIISGSLIAFALAFGCFLLLRAISPDLWHPIFGGEKPMETAYLNAMAQTGSYPPYDPWFADGAINYYFYGFYLFALIWNLTGIPFDIAFQLSLATIAGLFASGLFSLGSTLTRSVLHTRNTRWQIAGGGVTVAIVMFTGNFHSILETLRGQSLHRDFWESTRIVSGAINEFPYFSLLYADVHPHLMAAPVLVLVVALVYAWITTDSRADVPWVILWALVTAVAAGSVAVINLWDGPTAAVVLLAGLAFPLLRSSEFSSSRIITAALAAILIAVGGIGLFARFYAGFEPQTQGLRVTSEGTAFTEWATHFGGLLIPIIVLAGLALFGISSRQSTNRKLVMYGAILGGISILFGSAVASAGASVLGIVIAGMVLAGSSGALTNVAGTTVRRGEQGSALLLISPFIIISGILLSVRPVASASALLVAALITLYLANRSRDGAMLVSIVGASGAGLVLVADLVFIADHLHGSAWERMNTGFKLYFQSWTLLGIASAASLVWMAHRAFLSFRDPNSPIAFGHDNRRFAGLAVGCLAVVVLACGWVAYPILATPDRLDHRMDSTPSGLTLHGLEWMEGGTLQNQAGDIIDFSGDHDAVEWLNTNVSGTPVVLEASIGAYRGGGSRISSATGLPTVLGWAGHQSQQRGNGGVSERAEEVRELYQTANVDRKRYLLRKYAVEYIIVGDVERYTIVGDIPGNGEPDYYSSDEGLAAFEEMVADGELKLAFQSGNTVIYHVPPFPTAGEGR